MTKKISQSIVYTIKKQLMCDRDNEVIVTSWGAHNFDSTEYKGMPALYFEVSGFIHKGGVYVCHKNGAYDIYCCTNGDIVSSKQDVRCDQLTNVIDGMVEYDPSWTDEEYEKRIREFYSI